MLYAVTVYSYVCIIRLTLWIELGMILVKMEQQSRHLLKKIYSPLKLNVYYVYHLLEH
jgi:hypothetical protein